MFFKKYCGNCDKNQIVYWEIWYCDKNPDGLSSGMGNHGNDIDGTTTCEDNYCRPQTDQVDNDKINEEYVKTHEVHPRCRVCDHLIGD